MTKNDATMLKRSAETFVKVLDEKELTQIAQEILRYLLAQNDKGKITKKKDLKAVVKNIESEHLSNNKRASALDALEYYRAIDYEQEGNLYIYRITEVGKEMKNILDRKKGVQQP